MSIVHVFGDVTTFHKEDFLAVAVGSDGVWILQNLNKQNYLLLVLLL